MSEEINQRLQRDRALEIANAITAAFAGSSAEHHLKADVIRVFELIYDSALSRLRGEVQPVSKE